MVAVKDMLQSQNLTMNWFVSEKPMGNEAGEQTVILPSPSYHYWCIDSSWNFEPSWKNCIAVTISIESFFLYFFFPFPPSLAVNHSTEVNMYWRVKSGKKNVDCHSLNRVPLFSNLIAVAIFQQWIHKKQSSRNKTSKKPTKCASLMATFPLPNG